jgi:hypothetical protein
LAEVHIDQEDGMKLRLIFIIEVIFLVIIFFLVNIRSYIFWSLYPETGNLSGEAWRDVFIWLIALLMMYYLLWERGLIGNYLSAWLKEPALFGFVLFSLASVFWSNTWAVTLHRSLVFTFASLAAVFLGLRYSVKSFLQVLCWFGVTVVTASLALVFINPTLGTDLAPVYAGAWRGVFWHRNQLGNILPVLTLVFLFCFFSLKFNEAPGKKSLAIIFYFLSLVEVFFAKSASGYIIVILLQLAFGMAFLWLKIRHFLRPWHYYAVMMVSIVAAAGVLLNLGFIFGLLNREVNLTGRIPMWGILFRDVFPLNPWLGHGFGTIWADLSFRIRMRDIAGWPYPIMIGDNGFVDILLNLGVVGLILFLWNYIKVWINSIPYFLKELSLEGFFPFIFLIYTFLANLTFSLFMETEVFVWMLIVTMMVIVTQRKNEINAAYPIN